MKSWPETGVVVACTLTSTTHDPNVLLRSGISCTVVVQGRDVSGSDESSGASRQPTISAEDDRAAGILRHGDF